MRRKVADYMTRMVEHLLPELTVREAAALMKDRNIGCYPVCDGGRVVGMLTDRDLALRVLAEGRDPDLVRVDEAMTRNVVCCGEDESLSEVTERMGQHQVRRMPVVSRDGALIGLITLGKLASTDAALAGDVLHAVFLGSPT